MSRVQRIAFAVVAVAIVGAALLLIPSSETEQQAATTLTDAASRSVSPAGEPSGGESSATTGAKPAPRPRPQPPPLLRPGAVRTLSVRKDQLVRFRVRAPQPDTVHVHGYDREVKLESGRVATVRFRATIEGIFEIELHGSGEQIGKLVVEPK